MNVREAIAEGCLHLERRDAEVLLLHLLRKERAWLMAHPEEPVADDVLVAFRGLVARRAAREPLQYLTGVQEFYGLEMRVTPDVLIPRPETEHLVEAVELWATQFHDGRTLRVVDVGTGSGAIAIALTTHLAGVQMTAVDLSEAALAVAEGNARAHHCEDRIKFLKSDLLDAVRCERFEVVVSNPPYVPSGDAATMQPEVVDYEPHMALFAGDDGMAVYRRLVPQAHEMLKNGGLLAMEFGFGQREAMDALFKNCGWEDVRYVRDLQGIDRVVLATRVR